MAAARQRQRGLHDVPPLDEFEIDVLARRQLLLDLVAPAFEMIGPGLDRVPPEADRIQPETADPAIVVEKDEGRFAPRLVLVPVFYNRAQLVVAVSKEVGPHLEQLADNPLDGIASAIELGIHFLDLHPVLGLPVWMLRDWTLGADRTSPQDPHLKRGHGHRRAFDFDLTGLLLVGIDQDEGAVVAASGPPLQY